MVDFLVEHANVTADRWGAWVVALTLDTAALLALVGLLWFAIRSRVAPQVGYCLFLLVPLKLLLPLQVTVPASLAYWTPSALLSSSLDEADDSPRSNKDLSRSEEQTYVLSKAKSGVASEPGVELSANSQPVVHDFGDANVLPEANSLRTAASTAGVPVQAMSRSVAQPPRLSVSAIVMIIWLTGVLFLAARLIWTQRRFRMQLQGSSPVDESRFVVDLRRLCRRAGVTQRIRFVESDHITAPAVFGVVRPSIILPRGIASSLTAMQLRWVLLHELAHVRRRDLFVIVLQRCASILHFFNPVLWIANRVIHRLREYACDDLAVSLSDGSAIESGEAFTQVLRYANCSDRRLEGALGVFGLDSRASCLHRVRRMVDSERPIYTKPGRWSLCGLILLAIVSLPHLRAASDVENSNAQTAANDSTLAPDKGDPKTGTGKTATDSREFELHVVGPDGKPIAEATVELRTRPIPNTEQIVRGKFLKKGSYGAFVKTDASGCLIVKIPKEPTRFNISIKTAGYGPYWAGWTSGSQLQSIPSAFTAILEAGWSVGGVVVDDKGNPIEGVRIRPSIKYKKRPGDTSRLGVGTRLKTDAQGKWRFDSVPTSKNSVFVEISHPGFMPNRRPLTRSEFGLKPEQQPTVKITLNRGLTVTGRVTDEKGKPIAGAEIKTKFLNDIRKATTNEDGVYKLVGCETRTAKIVVSAKGRATDMKELRIEPDMESVDFQMQPGGRIRIRVLDEKDNPVPKARIFFQRWRGRFSYFEFGHVSQYADKNGVWEWNEAPLDEFKADICRPDGMQLAKQSLIARDEEYVFRPPVALVISGKVLDAETKKTIKQFLAVYGIKDDEPPIDWVRNASYNAADGRYRIRRRHDYPVHLVRIEADGYLPAVSRDIKSNEGNVTIDFALKKGKDVASTILTPEGAPAKGAKIALGVAGSQISVRNGYIDRGSTYNSAQREADQSGQFRFPPQATTFQLVITHPSGYAYIKALPEGIPEIIKLKRWAKVEGIYRVGKKPVANVPISLNVETIHSRGKDVPNIHTTHYETTGKNGRFVFERVVPGEGRIGRRIVMTVKDGTREVTSSITIKENFPAGETTLIELGGTGGRPVIGKLKPPKGFKGKVRWNFALVHARPEPDQSNNPSYRASVDRDGRFRIDDMIDGTYSLRVRISQHAAGYLSIQIITVPEADRKKANEPFDLGDLTLEKR